MIISIVWTGGFEIHFLGKKISCSGLTNPLIFLHILIFFRFGFSAGIKNTLVFIGALLFSAILAEASLRVLNPPIALPELNDLTQPSSILNYRMVPLLNDSMIQTNSHGLRDREFSYKKPDSIKRILGIGDSFTFGNKVRVGDCYLKQLEAILNRGKWEVINAGVTGYNMWQYLAYFKHYGYRYNPDLVTIGFFFDDFTGDPEPGDKRVENRRYRSFSFLRLVNFSRNCIDLLRYRYRYLSDASWLKSIEERREYILNSEDSLILTGKADPELYNKFEFRLKELNDIAMQHGGKVLVILIPDVMQLNHPEFKVVNSILENICKRCSVDYLDITPYFEGIKDIERLYLLPRDAHTSPEGHQIIARELANKIKAMNN